MAWTATDDYSREPVRTGYAIRNEMGDQIAGVTSNHIHAFLIAAAPTLRNACEDALRFLERHAIFQDATAEEAGALLIAELRSAIDAARTPLDKLAHT